MTKNSLSLCYNITCGGDAVQTLYIDVYFLINFTVDFIALYFAASFSKVPTTTLRLILGSLIGGLIATATVFIADYSVLKLIISVSGLYLTVAVSIKRVSLFRKIKTIIAYLIFGALLGGFVYYLYGIFDKYLYDYFKGSEEGRENRKILIFSIIVLLSIGVFKMLVSFFRNIESEGSCELEITFLGKTVKTEAFIDSGNLAIDPMDMRPVLFIKEDIAKRLLPSSVLNLSDPDKLDRETRKRIRLIPISRGERTHVMTGIRADGVFLLKKGLREELRLTVAIDREGGNYGGFSALLPSSAIQNEKK